MHHELQCLRFVSQVCVIGLSTMHITTVLNVLGLRYLTTVVFRWLNISSILYPLHPAVINSIRCMLIGESCNRTVNFHGSDACSSSLLFMCRKNSLASMWLGSEMGKGTVGHWLRSCNLHAAEIWNGDSLNLTASVHGAFAHRNRMESVCLIRCNTDVNNPTESDLLNGEDRQPGIQADRKAKQTLVWHKCASKHTMSEWSK